MLACNSTWVISFFRVFSSSFFPNFIYPPKWCTYSAGMAGATWNCCCLGTFCVHHTPMHHDFMQSHIHKVHACLAITCHLHFSQTDQDLLHATAVTQGWNGYQNKSQHRKLTLEKKILLPLLQGFEPTTFWSWVQHSNHWAVPREWMHVHVFVHMLLCVVINLFLAIIVICLNTFFFVHMFYIELSYV